MIKVGLIGLASWGEAILKFTLGLREGFPKLVAICDKDEEKLKVRW